MVNTFISAISAEQAFQIATGEPLPQHVKCLNQNLDNQPVPVANGYEFSGVNAGIKKTYPDLMMLKSTPPAVSAGVFTTNRVRAACVDYNEALVKQGSKVGAIVCNSGNANACTGNQGKTDTETTAHLAAEALKLQDASVFVASTGVIGKNLPMALIKSGISESAAQLSSLSLDRAAEAIMTTDTFSKFLSLAVELENGQTIHLSAIAKGSGMICPNMATMLGFFVTDASVSQSLLQQTLSDLNTQTFNAISVDGDTSTNDMALLLANGASETPELTAGSEDYNRFRSALHYQMLVMAKLIVLDGAGATKFIELDVKGAKSVDDAL
jgi:glutamate N-acetyltransferase/amino-acid N-acetyltransferase